MLRKTTFYPTYGYRVGAEWHIPIRVWIHKNHDLVDRLLTDVVADVQGLDSRERENFKTRTTDLFADDMAHTSVTVAFDQDRRQRLFPIVDRGGTPLLSDLNGVIEGTMRLPVVDADDLLASQSSSNGWLSFHTAQPPQGSGNVQLLDPEGDSVISDIDDTIKITEIPAGAKIVARNTFFRGFVAVDKMAGK